MDSFPLFVVSLRANAVILSGLTPDQSHPRTLKTTLRTLRFSKYSEMASQRLEHLERAVS